MKKRILSFAMALAMVLSILPVPALAAEGCANHPVHDESCGYVAAVEGQPCNHQHSEECRVETRVCTHVHTAECYPEGNMDGEPTLCEHVCSEESGCVTVSCNHVHDGECGYVEAVEWKPCGHSCERCNPPEEPEEAPVCTCDVKCNEMVNHDCPVCDADPSGCQGKAPEEPVCICQVRCTGDCVNAECPVCGADLTKCAVPEAPELPPVPQAVLDVQAMIDALPSLDEVKAMADKCDAYNQTQVAYEAYLALTEEEKALVTGTEIFEVLFTYFNEQIMMLPEDTGDFVVTGGTYGTDYSYDETQDILYILTSTKLTISTGGNPTSGMIRGLATGITYNLEFNNLYMVGTKNDTHVALNGSTKLTITGTNIIDVTGNGLAASNLTITSDSTGSLDIKGTSREPFWITGYEVSDVYLYINGGTLTHNNENNSCETIFTSGTGTINGKKYPGAAKVGDVTYSSLADAVAACPENGTITLLGDVTAMYLTLDKSVTLDIGGFTLTLEDDPGLEVVAGVTLTIDQSTHGGFITRCDHGTGSLLVHGSLMMKGNFGAQIIVRDGGTIDGGNYQEAPTVPENYAVVSTGGAVYPYQVKPAMATVTIGGTKTSYAYIDEAFEAVKDSNGAITLLQDGNTTENYNLSKAVTLKMNGKTLELYDLTVNGALTVTDGGTITGELSVTGTLDAGITKIQANTSVHSTIISPGIISGGLFSGGVTNYGTIEGGSFSGHVSGTGTIKGGRFASDPRKENTIAEGSVVFETGDEDYPWQVVASVGPFIVTGGTGYRWDEAKKVLTITESGLTVANFDLYTSAEAQIEVGSSVTSLTLNGVNIFHQRDALSIDGSLDLTLKGVNSLKSDYNNGVFANDALTIGGTGRVDIEGNCGINGFKSVSITSGTVNAKGNTTGIHSSGALSISGGEVNAFGSYDGINGSTTVSVSDGAVTTVGGRNGIYGVRGISITGGTGTAKGSTSAMSTAPILNDVVATGAYSEQTMSWEPATWTLTVTAPTFDAVNVGYTQPDAKAITITNSGNSEAFIASVVVDAPADASVKDLFEIDSGNTTTVPAGGTNTNYTIQPKAGLDVGEYKATVTVTYKKNIGAPDTENLTATAEVTFTVTREPVTYLDANGVEQTCADYTPVTNGMTTWGEANKATWYVVDGNVTISKYLTTSGDVHLILKNGCKLDAKSGITVEEGISLTIYGQTKGESAGTLTATGAYPGAGIGGLRGSSGTININGGTVNATGGRFAAGIGGCGGVNRHGSGGTITINGGTVNATGGEDGAGIGGGLEGSGGTIAINGGTVKATGVGDGAGIGGGFGGSGGEITISGGAVTASRGQNCDNDIGSGRSVQPSASIYIHREADLVNNNGNYPSVGPVVEGGTRVIEAKTMTMTETALTKAYGAASFTPDLAAYPSITTEKPQWKSSNENVATVDANGLVTVKGIGTADITASIAGTEISATCVLTVAKSAAAITVTADADEYTYGETVTLTAAVSATGTLPAARTRTAPAANQMAVFKGETQVSDPADLEDGKYTLKVCTKDLGAGESTLTVKFLGSTSLEEAQADVEVKVNKKQLTPSVIGTISKVYDGTTGTTGIIGLDGAVFDELPTVTGTFAFADANAGADKQVNVTAITLDADWAQNYALSTQSLTAAGTITPRPLTVTADAGHKTYGQNDPELTYTVRNLVTGDPMTGALARAPGENAGTYQINQGTLSAGSNYTMTFTGAVFTITKADPTVTIPTDLTATYGNILADVALPEGWTWDNGTASVGNAGSNVFSVTFTPEDTANYNTVTAEVMVTVNKATLTVTAEAKSKVYGQDDPALTYTVSGFAWDDTEAIVTGALARVTGENVGTYAIDKGSLSAGNNYTVSFTGANLTIEKASLTIQAKGQTITYGETIVTGIDQVTVTGLMNNETLEEITLTPSTADATDNGTITPSSAVLSGSLDNYNVTYLPGKLVIQKAAPTCTAPMANALTYSGQAQALVTAGATNGGSVLYSLDGTVYSDTIPVGTDAGSYTVYWKVDGGNNYESTAPATVAVTIAPAAITQENVTLAADITYDGTAQTPAPSVTVNGAALTAGTDYDVTYADNTNAGTATATVTGQGNYTGTVQLTFEIQKAQPAVPAAPTAATPVTYGQTLADTGLSADWVWENAATVPTVSNSGYTARYAIEDDSNYDWSGVEGYISAEHCVERTVAVTVNKADPEYTLPTGLTATYGDTLADVSLPEGWTWAADADTAVGNAGSNAFSATFTPEDTDNYNTVTESLTIAVAKAEPEYTAPTGLTATYGDTLENVTLPEGWAWDNDTASVGNAGESTFSATFTPENTDNYNTVTKNLTVAVAPKAITVTAESKTKIYGESDPELTWLVEGLVDGDEITVTLTRAVGENVGAYGITAAVDTGNNYTVTTVKADLTITAKPVTVTAEAKSKTYGDTDPELTYKASVAGVPFAGALAREPGENVGEYAITQGTLSAGGNYALTFVGAKLTVTPKSMTVTAENKTKVYGESDPELTWQAEGLVDGDKITVTLSRAEGENVGEYAVTGTVDAGDNYNVTFTGASLEITPKPVNVTADAQTKIYGSEDPQLSYTADVEDVPFTGELARTQGENVDGYAITQGTLTAGENYAITFVGAELTIGKKTLKVAAVDGSKVYGDADPELTYTIQGLVAGDEGRITVDLTRAPGENVGSYTIYSGINDQTGNYEIDYLEGTFTITEASLAGAEISVTPDSFTYDGTEHEPDVAVKLDGQELIPDTDYIVVYSGNVNAGTAIVTVTGKGNYSGTVKVEFTIEKALPTVNLPTLAPVTYGVKLSGIKLSAGWIWAEESIVPTVKNQGFLAYFAADEVNYDWTDVEGYDAENHRVSRTLTLTVNKADPETTIPTGLTASTGQTLADVKLPAGWKWNAPNTAVAETGEQKFPATFTPVDTDNYNTLTAELTVTVGEHLVKLDSKGGSAVPTQTVKNGEKAVKPTDPTREGYAFKGWYKDEDLKDAWKFEADKVTETMTLYAKWAKVYTYTLSYNANAGKATVTKMPEAETKESEDSTISFRVPFTKPKRSGYTFTGWNTQANGKGTKVKAGETIKLNGDLTLYAQWKKADTTNAKTGDYIMIAVGVLAVSGAALAGLLVYSKKKKK